MLGAQRLDLRSDGLAGGVELFGAHIDRRRGRLEDTERPRDEQQRQEADDHAQRDPRLADTARRGTAATAAPAALLSGALAFAPFAARRDRHLSFKNTHLNWLS